MLQSKLLWSLMVGCALVVGCERVEEAPPPPEPPVEEAPADPAPPVESPAP